MRPSKFVNPVLEIHCVIVSRRVGFATLSGIDRVDVEIRGQWALRQPGGQGLMHRPGSLAGRL